MQGLAIPVLLKGSDAVVAAETGSGKTIAYLAPLISHMLHRRDQVPPIASNDNPESTAAGRWASSPFQKSVIQGFS